MEVRFMAATYDDLSEVIDRVARSVAKDYPDIEWEDVRQELVVFVLQHGKSIKLREEGGNPKWLLERVAQTYAKKNRTQHLILTSQYAYRPSDVKQILETAFMPEQRENTYVPEDASSLDGIDSLQISSDVMAAYELLKPDMKEVLFRRYALNQVPSNETYERKRLNKAINELTLKLNSYRGSARNRRKVLSNAGARAAISEVYEGQFSRGASS
jgi:DNA-directed RNA polymerase specialized sigma24 family protein